MEGHWENTPGEGVPLILFGWPDMEAETTRFAVEIPHLGSLILTHSLERPVPRAEGVRARGPAEFDHRVLDASGVMVGLGVLMLLLGLWSAVAALARTTCSTRGAFLRFALLMGPARPDRDPRRLVHHRDRPPALGGLWRDAHRGCGLEPFRADALDDADRVRRDVFRGVRHRRQLHAEAGRQGAEAPMDDHPAPDEPASAPARPLSAAPDHVDRAIGRILAGRAEPWASIFR